ncbi:MAG: glutamine-hydrolyzing carbamoyl-phosphate synthase small subunit [Candidatus Aenigmarchaeota archaeon]|nr:glutamine-hydrolyzing carbamoyl-phosphate synthase small subunit [Candidatus Aenigmarchaeota archaeon]
MLVLEDGTVFYGKPFGASKAVSGEVVFNTGMVGYTEAITDPSYKGQILCQTYPLIGNYGVSEDDFESDSPKIEGYIVSEICKKPNHRTAQKSLDSFLAEHGVPGIAGIDTRALTKKLRMKGVMLGVLSTEDGTAPETKIPDPNETDLVEKVTISKPIFYENAGKTVVVMDCGVKMNIIRSLLERKLNVIRVPASYAADRIMELKPDGILISNGPGDPKKVDYVIEATRQLIEYKMPVFGICLGIQILALAMGGNTYKLKFGHRGQNHTCMDLKTKRCYITSQNHGYAVDAASLNDCEITFLNVNDKTVEGIEHKSLPVFGVQFHPEAAPGPTDTKFLFDKFVKMMNNE